VGDLQRPAAEEFAIVQEINEPGCVSAGQRRGTNDAFALPSLEERRWLRVGAAYRDCRATLDGLNLGRVSLLGMSFGGWLVLRYAVAAPERIQRLVLRHRRLQ
jgi:pimeloyl-ACP methyl ester carboxylesterase